MVNITETFTRMYNRPPTQRELGAMMKMQANPDYVRELLQREAEQARKPAPKPERKKMIAATYIDHMGSDLSVVNSARVSFGKKHTEFDTERDTKLIRYLAKHKHISPFGHAFASFHVKAPIFVARQLVKHKFLRWNETSRRYVDDKPEFYKPNVWRGRSADKKQGSEGVVELEEFSLTCGHYPYYTPEDLGLLAYRRLLEQGVAPEQARMVLPQSMMTEWYWSGSLDAFADMCNLRCKPDTQYESRLVADQISETMGELFPVSWAALI